MFDKRTWQLNSTFYRVKRCRGSNRTNGVSMVTPSVEGHQKKRQTDTGKIGNEMLNVELL